MPSYVLERSVFFPLSGFYSPRSFSPVLAAKILIPANLVVECSVSALFFSAACNTRKMLYIYISQLSDRKPKCKPGRTGIVTYAKHKHFQFHVPSRTHCCNPFSLGCIRPYTYICMYVCMCVCMCVCVSK